MMDPSPERIAGPPYDLATAVRVSSVSATQENERKTSNASTPSYVEPEPSPKSSRRIFRDNNASNGNNIPGSDKTKPPMPPRDYDENDNEPIMPPESVEEVDFLREQGKLVVL